MPLINSALESFISPSTIKSTARAGLGATILPVASAPLVFPSPDPLLAAQRLTDICAAAFTKKIPALITGITQTFPYLISNTLVTNIAPVPITTPFPISGIIPPNGTIGLINSIATTNTWASNAIITSEALNLPIPIGLEITNYITPIAATLPPLSSVVWQEFATSYLTRLYTAVSKNLSLAFVSDFLTASISGLATIPFTGAGPGGPFTGTGNISMSATGSLFTPLVATAIESLLIPTLATALPGIGLEMSAALDSIATAAANSQVQNVPLETQVFEELFGIMNDRFVDAFVLNWSNAIVTILTSGILNANYLSSPVTGIIITGGGPVPFATTSNPTTFGIKLI